MKIISVVGARPQFIKCSPVSRLLRKNHEELILHTGQHYDYELSQLMFEQLNIPRPQYNLEIGSGSHGQQTGRMLIELERVFMKEEADYILVYGDTNSTLAGALAAVKIHIPIAHVESGVRRFDKSIPEEVNRTLTDVVSDICFAPSANAVQNLSKEGINEGVFLVGDVMYDSLHNNMEVVEKTSTILTDLEIEKDGYSVATVHRANNTNNKGSLTNIVNAFVGTDEKIVFPVHPRTKKYLKKYNLFDKLETSSNVIVISPISYLDMLMLERHARKIITDSGGMEKEAYFLKKPCITLKESTCWVETVSDGWNKLVGTDTKKIINAIDNFSPKTAQNNYYGNGNASRKIKMIFDRIDASAGKESFPSYI